MKTSKKTRQAVRPGKTVDLLPLVMFDVNNHVINKDVTSGAQKMLVFGLLRDGGRPGLMPSEVDTTTMFTHLTENLTF